MKRGLALLMALAAQLGGQAWAVEEGWTFSLTPYLWLPNVNGTLKYSPPPDGSGGPQVDLGPRNPLENLQFALMLSGEARQGRWSVVTDLIYLDFGDQKSSVKAVNFGGSVVDTSLNASTRSSLKGLAWTLAGSYTAIQTPRGTVDVLGGVRYFGLKASTDWQLSASITGPQGGSQVFPQSGSTSQREDLWDAIVGVRGRLKLGGGNWFAPYYLDAGGGSSALTSQAFAGVGYAFKWGEMVLIYRYVHYDLKDDKLLQDLRFAGPALGAAFRF